MTTSNRKSLNLLPNFFRTEKNSKFLSSTLDQQIQAPQLDRLNGYVGSKFSKNYNPLTDHYIPDYSNIREAYQLEPGLVIKTLAQDIKKIFSYDDLINRLEVSGANVSNLNRLFKPKVYSYNPHIDWDKFVNFREYYWLPTGPTTVTIYGNQREVQSTYTVKDSADGSSLVFNEVLTSPRLTLYRGVTYIFNVKSKRPFYIKNSNTIGSDDSYNDNVSNNGASNGQIIFVVNDLTPAKLYYTSGDEILANGEILVRTPQENSFIDVENEIVGKSQYKSANGIEFINGLKITFGGDVTPEYYREKEFLVDGVGEAIKLIDWTSFQTPGSLAQLINTRFDGTNFDAYPFDDFKNIPVVPEYITISKASRDLNPWTRYNRWFHTSVIQTSAKANGVSASYSSSARATRPIVEFKPDLQLYNFGSESVQAVDLIDTVTTDVFSVAENSPGYYVDEVLLEQGNRVIFNADTDPLVRGRIFEANYVVIDNHLRLDLVDVSGSTPNIGSSTVVKSGNTYAATEWWFDGDVWIYAQQRTVRNQAPRFDLFDENNISYSNPSYYTTDFIGNNIFGYAIGSGTNDPVLGFPLKYRNIGIEGTYLFDNYFATQRFNLTNLEQVITVPDTKTFIKSNKIKESPEYLSVWNELTSYPLAIEQYQVLTDITSSIPVTVFNKPGAIDDLVTEVFVKGIKQTLDTDYVLTPDGNSLTVNFKNALLAKETAQIPVLIKFYTDTAPSNVGSYEVPLNLVNNPLNEDFTELTFSEISDHVQSMVTRSADFVGVFPGPSNLKDLPLISSLGTQLISLANPLSMAQYFLTDPEHNMLPAIRLAAEQFNKFKLNFIREITAISDDLTPVEMVDTVLSNIASAYNVDFPFKDSDMLGYGSNVLTRTYTVTDSRNISYAINQPFNISVPSNRSVLIYLNGEQLIYEKDYIFNIYDPVVEILVGLSKGDVLVIKDYVNVTDVYIAPTPSKLGLYPKFEPTIYSDTTYANGAQNVIQGHDGSLTLAFNDYRDAVILELEKRIYNNIKVQYRPELLDVNSILPNAFANAEFTYNEVYDLALPDFLRWASSFGLDYQTNDVYNGEVSKTFNYSQATDVILGRTMPGNWRGIFKYYFGTDRPNTHPWEMLGIYVMPSWWESIYGPAPYTSGNSILWGDLEAGFVRGGSTPGIKPEYARPGLSQMIPVDESGDLLDLRRWGALGENPYIEAVTADWKFGDNGPVEAAWRRSSYWPFVVQIMMALSKPADYAALAFDTGRISKNNLGQWVYGDDKIFVTPSKLTIDSLNAGYSIYVVEAGKQRVKNYLETLTSDLTNVGFNLIYKAGGFLSKDKLSVVIDSVTPNSVSPSSLIPQEDYAIFFNVSSPVRTVAISGLIVEKFNNGFKIKGYDKQEPYFRILNPRHTMNDTALSVGGVSETYYNWKTNTFYQQGRVVRYQNIYYRVTISHTSGSSFNSSYYAKIPRLAVAGGATVSVARQYEKTPTEILYGTYFSTVQEVYDVIVGYGAWLISQGFRFEEYNSELDSVLDWNFTGKEFLFWTTQNWADRSVITLSPFANSISYQFTDAVVDDVFNSFYEYSLIKADGKPLAAKYVSVNRQDGICTISNNNQYEGFFFARLNLVQKEHALVLNNRSMFNDVIYDSDTGYRQQRIKLVGFKTAEWRGDYYFPGFVYDSATIKDWQSYVTYAAGEVVRYVGKYYSSINKTIGKQTFDFADWTLLGEKPVADLLPNFDYKISQFEDFYSLDIDNFDVSQQAMAQHLVGYTPRSYLNNIFLDSIAQYKFYQGYIREKGTRNALDKLAKASIYNLQGRLEFNEEWAFRVGAYGSYLTYREIELPLREADFIENPQIVKLINDTYELLPNDMVSYVSTSDLDVTPEDWNPDQAFVTTSSDVAFVLPNAGYPRTDDVTATAYNTNSLLDIANNQNINEGDTIWLGFKENGSWDVYRYSKQLPKIVSVSIVTAGESIIFQTDILHNLGIGDVISVTQYDSSVNGVYVVKSTPALDQIEVASTITLEPTYVQDGLLFKFYSMRLSSFDDLVNFPKLNDINFGEKVWIDNASTGGWAVYEKTDNFSKILVTSQSAYTNRSFSYSVSTQDNSDIVVASAPNYYTGSSSYGRVFVYQKNDNDDVNNTATIDVLFNYGLNSLGFVYYDNATASGNYTGFGNSLVFDESADIIVAGAPLTSKVISNGTGIIFAGDGAASAFDNQGVVKLSVVDKIYLKEKNDPVVLVSPNAADNEYFGTSLAIARNTSSKYLLVGAPGNTINTGTVYVYKDLEVTESGFTITSVVSISAPVSGNGFGTEIVGDKNLNLVAISAPNNDGGVYIYKNTGTAYSLVQSLTTATVGLQYGIGNRVGSSIAMSDDGKWLAVGASLYDDGINQTGKLAVFEYKTTSSRFEYSQTLNNPSSEGNLFFGSKIDISEDGSILTVSSNGTGAFAMQLFSDGTTFDSDSTKFGEYIRDAGTVYVYNRYKNKFILAQELFDNSVEDYSLYSNSIAIDNRSVIIGAPGANKLYVWEEIDPNIMSWKVSSAQEPVVDISKIRSGALVNSNDFSLQQYVDIYDPIKGKVPGIADQEIRFKTSFDPAIYSVGIQGVVADTSANWIDDHVGELWWDLSTVKYIWYEQGDLEYRKNSWGTLFAGSTIDVYEWVSSPYLPSEWSALADTTEGLAQGISGQPKFADNSVVSVKQIYNSKTNSFSDVYYFWVKNKVTLPNVPNRKTSAYEVSVLIADPKSYGIDYFAPIASNALIAANVKTVLKDEQIHLNIVGDEIDNTINRHTEWMLIPENSSTSGPNNLLEKKLFDSLLGKDSLGNQVPDPVLSERTRYGISIRPRQSMFKDRKTALRNLIEYTNRILLENQITDYRDLSKLLTQDTIPATNSGQYDLIVEDNETREQIRTDDLVTAELSCNLTDGKITSINIDNSGYGYVIAPTVSLIGVDSSVEIQTEINEFGSIVGATVLVSDGGFVTPPVLQVRPFTVIVQSDSTSNGKWSKYVFQENSWIKIQTQKYDTTKYWSYVDWSSTDYNPYITLTTTVGEVYELDTLDLSVGDYVQVKNAGDSRYIVVRKTDQLGTFNADFDLVYSQRGTIQFSDALWNYRDSTFGFDQEAVFDQTLYDQTPDIELSNILQSIKNDLFINDLKVNWNNFFFIAVKYALTEQKFIDWAFKTSFISVRNIAGSLDQRAVYKFQDAQNYEQYLNEVKPYHTTVRNYTLVYDTVETSKSYTTDFDLPAVYNKELDRFETVSFADAAIDTYPFKGWADNYKYFVDSIVIADEGTGYTDVPNVVIVPHPEDIGATTATAQAYISLGSISEIIVTDPGSGYTKTPTVLITGGGSTELTPARAYAQLANNKVRTFDITMKFDRFTRTREIGSKYATDSWTCDGVVYRYDLSWAAHYDKEMITVLIDGYKVLADGYTLENYTEKVDGYTKHYSRLVMTNIPAKYSVLSIEYPKSLELYNAIARIEDYYHPTAGMPGSEPSQIMSGLEYPGIKIETLFQGTDGRSSLTAVTNWDQFNFGELVWDAPAVDTGTSTSAYYELDTIYDGGSWSTNTSALVGALGINPSDVTLDGDSFISPYTSYAPEEMIPGQVRESIGINVFTRVDSGSPSILTSAMYMQANTSGTALLSITPPSIDAVSVWFNGISLEYSTDYSIDFTTNQIQINAQPAGGIAAITVIGVGGSRFIDSDKIIVSNTSTAYVYSALTSTLVRSFFVTVNGRAIGTDSTSTEYYSLGANATNDMTKITVNNLDTGTNTIQSWAFNAKYKGFSEVKEQIVEITTTTDTIDLIQTPGVSWSQSTQAMVELNGRRLTPPDSSYYVAAEGQIEFSIDPDNSYPLGVFDLLHTSVFVNGVELRKGFDFFLDQPNNKIIFDAGHLSSGDLVVITNSVHSDYVIENNQLVLVNSADLGDVVKITTFTNQDSSYIMNEVFEARSSRLYPISRIITDDNYVWVSIGGLVLTNRIDFYVMNDGRTIKIKDSYPFDPSQIVVITSFNNTPADYTIGYRIFRDILGRVQYKRLSDAFTTQLSQPLELTDDTISVVNADILPTPDLERRIPGVILLNGERIEYYGKSNNTLTDITRSTMGTGPRDKYPAGTQVIDQSIDQLVPFVEVTNKQVFTATNSTSTVYVITDISFINAGLAAWTDQVEVYYGGVQLAKPTASGVTRVKHLSTVTYDATTASTIVLSPEFNIVDNAGSVELTVNPAAGLIEGARISVVQRQSSVWYEPGMLSASNGESLLTADTTQANFLRAYPSANPDKYFYGQL